MSTPDIRIIDHGTLVGFIGLSDAGLAWLDEHVEDNLRMGRVIWADHRPAQAIVDGAQADGLSVGP